MEVQCPHPAAEVLLISFPSYCNVQLMRALISPCASYIPAQSIIPYPWSVNRYSGGTNTWCNLYFLPHGVNLLQSTPGYAHFYFCADLLSSYECNEMRDVLYICIYIISGGVVALLMQCTSVSHWSISVRWLEKPKFCFCPCQSFPKQASFDYTLITYSSFSIH